MFRKSAYLFFIMIVLGLSLAAQADFDTVGVYDPTDDPHSNDVDQSGTFVSATGVAGPDNVIDLETFQALVGLAFESDTGGVVNGEAPGTINGEDILAHYGINRVKTLTITNNSGHIKSVGEGNLNRLPTSGDSGFGKDDDPDTLFTIGNITGGTPDEVVTYFAFTVLDRDDRTITPTVTAEFSDGSTVVSSATMDGSQPSNDQDTFFGFAAPAGTGIVSVNFDLSNWSNMDDLGFITSAFSVSKESASRPNPANEAEDVLRDVILSWKPGEFADRHDVYLGTNFEDVNNADVDSLLLVSPAQDANSYDAGRLEFGQRYFWRIDEINAPPNDDVVFKGPVWSFTVEPYATPIPGDMINATASSSAPGQGPEQTINGSGLDDNDLHSKDTAAMWLTASDASSPAWIEYDFDKPYKLFQMLVWNYNGESILSLYGIKDVSVEYSIDGSNWTQVNDVSEFSQGPGAESYAAGTLVDFDGVAATSVRITAISNWGGDLFTQFGLSEVRYTHIPVSAREPNPESEATDVNIDTTLSWRAGREAAEHNVYISTDQLAVSNGTAPVVTVGQTSYGPLSLNLGSDYFWRIDEVNNAKVTSVWPGDIWSFSTQEYLVVDDFESYNEITTGEEGSNLVYATWSDGYDNPSTNGSAMGYTLGTSMETDTVHSGEQSVPLIYNNSEASLSEVTVNPSSLTIGRDWTKGGATALVLWFYGDPNNATTEQIYVKINGAKVTYDGNPGSITVQRWNLWVIDLTTLGINQNNVTTFTIGFERTGATGGSGTVLIDDIRLYRVAPSIVEPTDPGTDALVAYYAFENNVNDSSGNGLNGTIVGTPDYVAGVTGMALSLDGVDDYVGCGDNASFDITAEITLTAWVNTSDSGNGQHNPFVGKGDQCYAIKHASNNSMEFFIYDSTWQTLQSPVDESFNGTWHHVAGTFDGNQIRLYVDGSLANSVDYTGAIATTTYPVNIGRNSQNTDRLYEGAIDEVRIYNRALSEAEVLYLAIN